MYSVKHLASIIYHIVMCESILYKTIESIRVVQRPHVYYSLGTCYTLLTLLTCDELGNGRKSLEGEYICELKGELIPWGSIFFEFLC